MTVWDEIDEPVLRWLAEQPPSLMPQPWRLQLTLRPDPEPNEIRELDSHQVDDALQRLLDHGLIDGGRNETIGYAMWSRLRLTALGLQILGEWPELDRLANAAGLRLLLARLAEAADDPDDEGALRGLVGFAAQLGEDVVNQTLSDVGRAAAEGLA